MACTLEEWSYTSKRRKDLLVPPPKWRRGGGQFSKKKETKRVKSRALCFCNSVWNYQDDSQGSWIPGQFLNSGCVGIVKSCSSSRHLAFHFLIVQLILVYTPCTTVKTFYARGFFLFCRRSQFSSAETRFCEKKLSPAKNTEAVAKHFLLNERYLTPSLVLKSPSLVPAPGYDWQHVNSSCRCWKLISPKSIFLEIPFYTNASYLTMKFSCCLTSDYFWLSPNQS